MFRVIEEFNMIITLFLDESTISKEVILLVFSIDDENLSVSGVLLFLPVSVSWICHDA